MDERSFLVMVVFVLALALVYTFMWANSTAAAAAVAVSVANSTAAAAAAEVDARIYYLCADRPPASIPGCSPGRLWFRDGMETKLSGRVSLPNGTRGGDVKL